MSRKKPQHTKQFKLDAINYRKEHPDLTQAEVAKNLGIGVSTLARWEAQFRDCDGDIPVRGSGNYESEFEKQKINGPAFKQTFLPHSPVFLSNDLSVLCTHP